MLRRSSGGIYNPPASVKLTCVCAAIVLAVPRTSSLKSFWSLFDVRRPTTPAKITRMTRVRAADTAARRQRTGQRFGVRRPRIRSSLFISRRPDHVPRSALGVEDPRLAARLQLATEVGDEDVDRVGERH